jgi:hypothetical protein
VSELAEAFADLGPVIAEDMRLAKRIRELSAHAEWAMGEITRTIADVAALRARAVVLGCALASKERE